MLLPQRFDFLIFFFPFGNRRSPVAEDGCDLSWRTALAGRFKNLPHGRRNRIGLRLGSGRDAEAESPEVVVLVVVAIPAAVILRELELELRPAGEAHRLL